MKHLFKTILLASFVLFAMALAAHPAFAQSATEGECITATPGCTKCDESFGRWTCVEWDSSGGTLTNPIAPNLSPQTGPEGVQLFSSLVQTLVSTLIVVAAVVFFFFFMIGAIRWIVSGGDKAQIESARGTIVNALVGLVIAFSLFAVLKLLETIFGIDLLEINLGPLVVK
ncbi:hypothetical protein CMO96_04995 [Candidatus Woesebacteria bacterium]|nr:hypothetical protein [Candidatus Woesebacteria bacterium]|tara:strand:+ start:117 stop:629 length:513 start_codon:yes stop_codon:yes gene_type:complete